MGDVAYYHKLCHASRLQLGFKGNSCSFEHRAYDDRSPEQQAAYEALRGDLKANGMIDPLITYQGHILIGMRRFEIMRELGQVWFDCLEIDEPVEDWRIEDIRRLNTWKWEMYSGVRYVA